MARFVASALLVTLLATAFPGAVQADAGKRANAGVGAAEPGDSGANNEAAARDEIDAETAVRAREQAFADSMAKRDFAAFLSFLSDEAVFWSADGVDRGKTAVAARWSAYFEDPAAPFSWRPEDVAVLDSGELAFSSGPVFGADGTRTATFHSVWRLDSDGEWRIVFDRGARWCPPPDPAN